MVLEDVTELYVASRKFIASTLTYPLQRLQRLAHQASQNPTEWQQYLHGTTSHCSFLNWLTDVQAHTRRRGARGGCRPIDTPNHTVLSLFLPLSPWTVQRT